MRIMLDPGHAGAYYNASPVVSGYYESAMTWSLAAKLKAALEDRGFVVGLTRQNRDEDPELTERGRRARGYDLFLSLHSNAATFEEADAPWLIHLAGDADTEIDEESVRVAVALGRVIPSVMGVSDSQCHIKRCDFDRNGDGKLNDEWYGVLFGAKSVGVPAVIVEHSFHTNRHAAEWLLDEGNLEELAQAEADALAEYYGMEGSPMTKEEKKELEALKMQVATLEKKLAASEADVASLKKTRKKYDTYKVFDNVATKWNYVDANLPSWAAPTIEKLTEKKILVGNTKGELELSYLLMRILVMLDRAGML